MFKITKAQIMHVLAVPISILAGWCATLVGNNIPGVHLTSGWLGGIFTTAAVGALGLAIHYLHNWAWWEKNVAPVVDVTNSDAEAANLTNVRNATFAVPSGAAAKKTY